MYAGIEAGGTKFICAVCDSELKRIDEIEIPTTDPQKTLAAVFEFFDKYSFESIGVGSFGPIGIDPERSDYGNILSTPKAGWANFDFLGEIKKRYPVPCAWTTDVNAAAYGELKAGAAKGKQSCIYLTVGTGIGGGAVLNGNLLQGMGHPEMGHIFVKRHPTDDYEGGCPYHHDCLEGLAAGPSIEKRMGAKGETLAADDPWWGLQAYYLAQALVNYTLILSPEKIILGGGVMKQSQMIGLIREQFQLLMNGYVEVAALEEYIVPWSMPGESGIMGALFLARDLVNQQ